MSFHPILRSVARKRHFFLPPTQKPAAATSPQYSQYFRRFETLARNSTSLKKKYSDLFHQTKSYEKKTPHDNNPSPDLTLLTKLLSIFNVLLTAIPPSNRPISPFLSTHCQRYPNLLNYSPFLLSTNQNFTKKSISTLPPPPPDSKNADELSKSGQEGKDDETETTPKPKKNTDSRPLKPALTLSQLKNLQQFKIFTPSSMSGDYVNIYGQDLELFDSFTSLNYLCTDKQLQKRLFAQPRYSKKAIQSISFIGKLMAFPGWLYRYIMYYFDLTFSPIFSVPKLGTAAQLSPSDLDHLVPSPITMPYIEPVVDYIDVVETGSIHEETLARFGQVSNQIKQLMAASISLIIFSRYLLTSPDVNVRYQSFCSADHHAKAKILYDIMAVPDTSPGTIFNQVTIDQCLAIFVHHSSIIRKNLEDAIMSHRNGTTHLDAFIGKLLELATVSTIVDVNDICVAYHCVYTALYVLPSGNKNGTDEDNQVDKNVLIDESEKVGGGGGGGGGGAAATTATPTPDNDNYHTKDTDGNNQDKDNKTTPKTNNTHSDDKPPCTNSEKIKALQKQLDTFHLQNPNVDILPPEKKEWLANSTAIVTQWNNLVPMGCLFTTFMPIMSAAIELIVGILVLPIFQSWGKQLVNLPNVVQQFTIAANPLTHWARLRDEWLSLHNHLLDPRYYHQPSSNPPPHRSRLIQNSPNPSPTHPSIPPTNDFQWGVYLNLVKSQATEFATALSQFTFDTALRFILFPLNSDNERAKATADGIAFVPDDDNNPSAPPAQATANPNAKPTLPVWDDVLQCPTFLDRSTPLPLSPYIHALLSTPPYKGNLPKTTFASNQHSNPRNNTMGALIGYLGYDKYSIYQMIAQRRYTHTLLPIYTILLRVMENIYHELSVEAAKGTIKLPNYFALMLECWIISPTLVLGYLSQQDKLHQYDWETVYKMWLDDKYRIHEW